MRECMRVQDSEQDQFLPLEKIKPTADADEPTSPVRRTPSKSKGLLSMADKISHSKAAAQWLAVAAARVVAAHVDRAR